MFANLCMQVLATVVVVSNNSSSSSRSRITVKDAPVYVHVAYLPGEPDQDDYACQMEQGRCGSNNDGQVRRKCHRATSANPHSKICCNLRRTTKNRTSHFQFYFAVLQCNVAASLCLFA
jgi:hypothetical protein